MKPLRMIWDAKVDIALLVALAIGWWFMSETWPADGRVWWQP